MNNNYKLKLHDCNNITIIIIIFLFSFILLVKTGWKKNDIFIIRIQYLQKRKNKSIIKMIYNNKWLKFDILYMNGL